MESERNLLVVVLDEKPDVRRIRSSLGRRADHATVRIVAPAHVGFLSWYTTDEDTEHAQAEERARETEEVLARAPEVDADTEAAAGDADPVLAVQDALAEFPADEVVVVGTEADDKLESSLHRFGLPVTWLGASTANTPRDRGHETGRGVMSGRSDATPYALVGAVMLVLLAVAVLVLLVAALALWAA